MISTQSCRRPKRPKSYYLCRNRILVTFYVIQVYQSPITNHQSLNDDCDYSRSISNNQVAWLLSSWSKNKHFEHLTSIHACRKNRCAEKKKIATLTLSILKTCHTLISSIIFWKLYSVATPGYPKPLLLENHVRIVTLTPDLQRVSFYSVIDFLYHSFHYQVYTIPDTYKGVIRALRPNYDAGMKP